MHKLTYAHASAHARAHTHTHTHTHTQLYMIEANQGQLDDVRFVMLNIDESPVETARFSNIYTFTQQKSLLYVVEVPVGSHDQQKVHLSRDGGKSFTNVNFPIKGVETSTKVVAMENMALAGVVHTLTETSGDAFVEVNSNNISAAQAEFTPRVPSAGLGPLIVAEPQHSNLDGCSSLPPAGTGNYVIRLQRGNCYFYVKIANAEDAGYKAVLIVNTEEALVGPSTKRYDWPVIPAFTVPLSALGLLEKGAVVRLLETNVREKEVGSESNFFASGVSASEFWLSLIGLLYQPAENSEDGWQEEIIDLTTLSGQDGVLIANFVDFRDNVVSVISFNSGNTWQSIDGPGCMDDSCKLHIGMEVSADYNGLPLPQTAPHAAQLIMANGYIGEGVGADMEDADVFVSTSGGCSWNKVLDGPHELRILDSGSVLLALPTTSPTNSIKYSLDYGATFKSFQFLPDDMDPVFVRGLVADPSTKTLTAFIYYSKPGQLVGVMINFTAAFSSAACTNSKYKPQNLNIMCGGRSCINGMNFEYEVRTVFTCYNGQQYTQATNIKSCPCEIGDFQCIPGFIRDYSIDNATSPCVADGDLPLHCEGSDTTIAEFPYAVTPGDNCMTSLSDSQDLSFLNEQHMPCIYTRTPTPTKYVSKASWSTAWLVLVLLLMTLLFIFSIALFFSKRLRDRALKEFGWDGCIARAMVKVGCLRPSKNFRYNNMDSTMMDFEQDTDMQSNEEDDEMLFGAGDANLVT
jgi:hypothetical protein